MSDKVSIPNQKDKKSKKSENNQENLLTLSKSLSMANVEQKKEIKKSSPRSLERKKLQESLDDYLTMSEEINSIEKSRGFLYPLEKQRIKALENLIRLEEEKIKNLQTQKEQDKHLKELLTKKKPLYLKIEQQFHEQEQSELEKRKSQLAQIRQMHQPITIDKIFEHMMKSEEQAQKLAEQNKKEKLAQKIEKIEFYESPFYKQQKEQLKQQTNDYKNFINKAIDINQLKKQYNKDIKSQLKITISQEKKEELESSFFYLELQRRYFNKFDKSLSGYQFLKGKKSNNSSVDLSYNNTSLQISNVDQKSAYQKGLDYLRSQKSSEAVKIKSKASLIIEPPPKVALPDYLTEKKNSKPNLQSKQQLYEKRLNRIFEDNTLSQVQVLYLFQKQQQIEQLTQAHETLQNLENFKNSILDGQQIQQPNETEKKLSIAKNKLKILQDQ